MQYLGSISGLISSQSPGVLFFDEVLDEDLPNVKDCLVNSVLVRARTCSGADNILNPIRGQATESVYYYTYLKHGRVDTAYSADIYAQMATCTKLGCYTSAGDRSAYRTANTNKRSDPGTFMLNPFDEDHKIFSAYFSFRGYLSSYSFSVTAFYLAVTEDKTTNLETLMGSGYSSSTYGSSCRATGILSGSCDYIDFCTQVTVATVPSNYSDSMTSSMDSGLMYTDDKITAIERITLTSALVCAKEFCMKLTLGTNYTVGQNLVPGQRPVVKWVNTFEPVNL